MSHDFVQAIVTVEVDGHDYRYGYEPRMETSKRVGFLDRNLVSSYCDLAAAVTLELDHFDVESHSDVEDCSGVADCSDVGGVVDWERYDIDLTLRLNEVLQCQDWYY